MPRAAAPAAAHQMSLFDTAPDTASGPAPQAVTALPPPRQTAPDGGPGSAAAGTPPSQTRAGPGQREITIDGHRIAYRLRRASRRSIGFVICADGLLVTAPRWLGQADIDAALQVKARWVLRKLHELGERQRRQREQRVHWGDGGSFPFLGETVTIVIDARNGPGAVLNADARALPGVPRLTLHLGLPHDAQPAQVRDAVHAWLQRQARRIFEERCRHFEPRLGVRMQRLALSAAATRWGSASADGAIRLNWRLVHLPMASIDYVVAHELAHLREMNHSAAFWDVVGSVIPDWRQRRRDLRSPVLPPHDDEAGAAGGADDH